VAGTDVREGRVHPIVRVSHVPRLFAFPLAALITTATLRDRGLTPELELVALAVGVIAMAWPFVALAVALRSPDTRAAGLRNVHADALLAGLVAGATGLCPMPAGTILVALGTMAVMQGGFPLLFRAAPLAAAGLVAGVAAVGLHPLVHLGYTTAALCVAFQAAVGFFFAIIDPATGRLAYVNGGHEAPAVVGGAGVRARLGPTGPAVGALAGSAFSVGEAALAPGETLFAFTDGLTEARSGAGEMFTEERLLRLLDRAEPATATLERVEAAMRRHADGADASDDVTLVALRRGADG